MKRARKKQERDRLKATLPFIRDPTNLSFPWLCQLCSPARPIKDVDKHFSRVHRVFLAEQKARIATETSVEFPNFHSVGRSV